MNRVFVDTGGFYAALNRRDAYHREAVLLFSRTQREHWFLFTTNFVLAESHALILARMGRNRAWSFLQAIITGSTNVIRAEEADEQRARAIIEQYQDKEFSYCDVVSFAVMERLDIQEAIAFDDHFRQYGQFTIL
jgi:predicted nucleic acid-binding protein